jgi:hypothetical protein
MRTYLRLSQGHLLNEHCDQKHAQNKPLYYFSVL